MASARSHDSRSSAGRAARAVCLWRSGGPGIWPDTKAQPGAVNAYSTTLLVRTFASPPFSRRSGCLRSGERKMRWSTARCACAPRDTGVTTTASPARCIAPRARDRVATRPQ